jgi:hypothetical protein
LNPISPYENYQTSDPCATPASVFFTTLELDPQIPAQLLQAYSLQPLDDAEELLQLYVPGASLVTEGLLRQCSDAELMLVSGLFEQLLGEANGIHTRMATEREQLKADVAHRRQYAELVYQMQGGQ